MKSILVAAVIALAALPGPAGAESCLPGIDEGRPQFVIGYGSLMETASKKRSSPTSGLNHPVRVTGFQRAWNTRGSDVGFSTTYLGVEVAGDASMVAVVYEDIDRSDLSGTDDREVYYCRKPVEPAQIQLLDGWALPGDAQVWIYVNKPTDVLPPERKWPIVQSYVDIFLTGCLQLQERLLPEIAAELDFASACIETTAGWSPHWKNDRLYPRRPFIYQPHAAEIDRLLAKHLPELFSQIEIE